MHLTHSGKGGEAMGYDVSIGLRNAGERAAYDAAAKELGIEHSIETYGGGEPSDWQVRELWSGCSVMKGLAEFLCGRGERVLDDGDGSVCPDYEVDPKALAAFGSLYEALAESYGLGGRIRVVESLGLIGDEVAAGYWHELERGVTSKAIQYGTTPIVSAVSLPELRGSLVRDDAAAPIPSGHKDALDASLAVMRAEHAASEATQRLEAALADGIPEEEEIRLRHEQVEANHMAKEARNRLAALKPHQDTFRIHMGEARVITYDQSTSTETETCDPHAGAAFMACVAAAIQQAFDDGAVADVYEALSAEPALMLFAFRRLGKIGRAAEEAGIERLVVSQSW